MAAHPLDQASSGRSCPRTYIGVGEQFDDGNLRAYPPGAVIVLPGGTPHFHWARSGEYVTQITAFGPISLEYLDPADDPRYP